MDKLLLPEVVPSLISYHLGLSGPAMLVQTACVSSLSALHIASRALQAGDCTSALVGAVNIIFPQMKETKIQTDMILSPEGKLLESQIPRFFNSQIRSITKFGVVWNISKIFMHLGSLMAYLN